MITEGGRRTAEAPLEAAVLTIERAGFAPERDPLGTPGGADSARLAKRGASMEVQPGCGGVNSIPRLYELRCGQRMRAARAWFALTFNARNLKDLAALRRPGQAFVQRLNHQSPDGRATLMARLGES